MAFIREKKINGRKYLYLVESERSGDEVKQKVLEYLGPKEKFLNSDLPAKFQETLSIEQRERKCLETLDSLPKNKYILVGGLAQTTYFPRTTIDADLVINAENLKIFTENLQKLGYNEEKERSKKQEIPYEGEFKVFDKNVFGNSTHVDLMVNMIKARQTDVGYSYDYLAKNTEKRDLRGMESGITVENVRVVDRETLISLKINSARFKDQKDVIALCSEEVDTEKIAQHLRRAPKEKIIEHIENTSYLASSNIQKDSIKGDYQFTDKE